MNRSVVSFFSVVAVVGIGAFVLNKFSTPSSGRKQVGAQSSQMAPAALSGTSNKSSRNKIEKSDKALDVFFLSEGVQDRSTSSSPAAMQQPVVTGKRKVVAKRAITTKADGEFIAPRWSPDGLQLLVTRPGYNGLYTVDLNSGNVTQVTDREGVGFRAKWSSDGKIETRSNDDEVQTFKTDGTPMDAAAYETDASLVGAYTKDDTVYLRKNPGEAPVPITDGSDRFYGGVISPDGKYIAYNGMHTGLYIKPMDGSAPAVNVGEGYSPAWLPDGSGLVYDLPKDDGHNVTGSDLYLTTPDGKDVSNLTQTNDTIEQKPTVSPDGSSISYEVDGVIYVGQLE